MKKIYFLCCLLFFVAFCFSQTVHEQRLDSLYGVLSIQKEDTLKVNLYDAICRELKNGNTQKVSFYNSNLLKLSQKLNYQKGFGLYFLNLSQLCYLNGEYKKSIIFVEKSKNIFYKIKDWDNYFYSCCHLGYFFSEQKKINEAKTIFLKSIQLANKKRNFRAIGQLYYRLSSMCIASDMPKDGLIYSNLALKYPCDKNTKSKIYNNIAFVNIAFNNFEQAAKYNNLALSKVESPVRKNYIYIQKINILIEQKKFKEALATIIESKKNEKILDQQEKDFNTFYLSICYYHLKKYDLALRFINEVLSKPLSSDNNFFKVQLYTHLSDIYLAINNKLRAKQIIDTAIGLFDPVNFFELELKLYTTKYQVEQAMGNFEEALVYFKKMSEIKDKNAIRMNQEKLSYLQASFEINDKNNEIKSLEVAQLKREIVLKKQKNYTILFAILLIFALLSVAFFVKNNKIIKNKNTEIEREKLFTQKSLQEKETLLKEIHHRVKNNMQLVISLLKIQSLDSKKLTIEDFVEVSEARINSMALIHENLYLSETLDKVSFKEYLNNLKKAIIDSRQGSNHIQLKVIENEVCLDIQTAIPIGLIVNELVNNAYKHAFINKNYGKIEVELKENQSGFLLSVTDNGIGFNDNQKKQDGLGLELVKLLVSQIKGVLKVDNSAGAAFRIQFQNIVLET